MLRTILTVAALLTAGCSAQLQTVSLKLTANVDDAEVTIDDEAVGSVARVEKRGVALPPGKHRISIEKTGYFPYDGEVLAKPGDKSVTVEVTLEKVPD
jgi:hypothetical protein